MKDDDFVPVNVGGTQNVEVGTLKYTSILDGYPSARGYFLCRLETSFGGPYYRVMFYDPDLVEHKGSFIAYGALGEKSYTQVCHWAPLPKIPLDAVVPTPSE